MKFLKIWLKEWLGFVNERGEFTLVNEIRV